MKIRTDFVTNSSSSSYVIEFSISYSNDQGKKKKIYFQDDWDYEDDDDFMYPAYSPKELGQADSIDDLVSMLFDCIGNEDDDEKIKRKKAEVMKYLEPSGDDDDMWEPSDDDETDDDDMWEPLDDDETDDDDMWEPSPADAKRFAEFLNEVKAIQNIDKISEIVISCEGYNNRNTTSEFCSFNRLTNDYFRSKDFDDIDCGDDMLMQQLRFKDASQATCIDEIEINQGEPKI